MIKKIFVIPFLLLPFILSAAYLVDFPVSVTQPDGTILHCYATGDEFYNWLHDENRFTIIQSQEDGYYYYARLENGSLVPSKHKAGETDPYKTGLEPGVNIPAKKIRDIRRKIEKETPDNPTGFADRNSRSEGTMNNIVIYLRFGDQAEFEADTSLYYNLLNNSGVGGNSLYNYFHEASYKKLSILSSFHPGSENNIVVSYQDNHERSYFMPYNSQTNPNGYHNHYQKRDREHALLEDAIQYINVNDPIPESLDLDFDDDGMVDNIIFIIRGAPTAWGTLLWPHRWSLYSKNVMINGKRVWNYNFQIETHLNSSGVGVLCHEMFHTLGAPDLYHYTNNGIKPAGEWDIMQHTANPPQYMSSYMKYKYGRWLDSIPEISTRGTYYLHPLQNESKNCYKIASANTPFEYFVVEYRKKEGTFESSLPGSGLLIYRIDSTAGDGNADGPPDEVYLYRPGGTLNKNGNTLKAAFAGDYNRTIFNDHTDPACFLQNGEAGGLSISQISHVGDSMSFFVDLPGPPVAALDAEATLDCVGSKISFFDQSVGIPSHWEWSFEPNTVSFAEGTDENTENPVVIFHEPGYYSVKLSVSNQFDSDEVIEEHFIEIGSFSGAYSENFEVPVLSHTSWQIESTGDELCWELAQVEGNGNGNQAVMINFRDIYAYGQRDRLISPPLNLSGMNTTYLYFEHAYAQNNPQVSDSLIIYISKDCGQTWSRIFADAENGSGNFATHPLTTEPFIPQSAEDWCLSGFGSDCNSIDISAWVDEGPVKIAFESFSLFGNPLYIDNVVIGETVGEYEYGFEDEIEIYPNPSSGLYMISGLDLNIAADMNIYNLQGKCVRKARISPEQQGLSLDLTNLPTGLYLLSISTGEKQILKKLMKQ